MAPVSNNPNVNHQTVRPGVDPQWGYGLPNSWLPNSTAINPAQPVSTEALRQFSQNQAQQLQMIQQGNLTSSAQAQQASFMSPADYRSQYPQQNGTVTTPIPAQQQYDGTTLYNSFQDQAQMKGIIDDMMNESSQLRSIANNPRAPKILMVYAALIIAGRKKIDNLMEKVSGLTSDANSTDSQLQMAVLTNDIRDQARLNDTASNTLKLDHDSKANTNRNMKA